MVRLLARPRTLLTGAMVATGLFAIGATLAPQAAAHPLGNFTVNQYSRIEVLETGPRIIYVLDMAEVPAFQTRQEIDTNGDASISQEESDAYLNVLLNEITPNLNLVVDGERLSLGVESAELTFPKGQAGLDTLRLEAVVVPRAPNLFADGTRAVAFRNDYASDRLGWREIVVTHGAGIEVTGVDIPSDDISRELSEYPENLLASPLDQTAVAFSTSARSDMPAAAGFGAFGQVDRGTRPGGSFGGQFAALLDGRDLSTGGLFVTLLAAMAWGAAHALSPGHGKTIVAAYLVGSRGAPRHATYLGATVTLTHTAGVLALGAVTLFASRFILPETLFPWLSVVSGALVVVMGVWTLIMRLNGRSPLGHHHHDHVHDHDHPHSHPHDGAPHSHGGHTHSHLPPESVSWRGLTALGVAGGLIPCPSALVVLLGSIAIGRTGLGLALVVAFSLGLALTLTLLGVLFIYAGDVLERRVHLSGRLSAVFRMAPFAGSVVLTIAGLAIMVRALAETSLR